MNSNSGTDHIRSSWICIAGLSNELTEGDIITVFSQFGEVVNINLLRHRQTGRSRGMCFLCYQNLASTILAVDNFNGITVSHFQLLRRKLKVNYVDDYKMPKLHEDSDETMKRLLEEGCAPKPIRLYSSERHKLFCEDSCKRERSFTMNDQRDKCGAKLEKEKKKEIPVNKSKCYYAKYTLPKEIYVRKDLKFKPPPKYSAIKANWHDVETWKETRGREKADLQTKVFLTRDFVHVPKRYR